MRTSVRRRRASQLLSGNFAGYFAFPWNVSGIRREGTRVFTGIRPTCHPAAKTWWPRSVRNVRKIGRLSAPAGARNAGHAGGCACSRRRLLVRNRLPRRGARAASCGWVHVASATSTSWGAHERAARSDLGSPSRPVEDHRRPMRGATLPRPAELPPPWARRQAQAAACERRDGERTS